MTALYNDLCQTVEGRDAELTAVLHLRMILAQVRGIAVTDTYEARVPVKTEHKHGAGIGYNLSFLILHFYSYYRYVTPICSNRHAICFQHNLASWLGSLYDFCQ